MIEASHISMDFTLIHNPTKSLKEYAIRTLKRQNQKECLHVLKDISFNVKRGEVMGIVGKNGAGKSTLLKIVSGILRPTRGEILVKGTIAPLLELGSGMDPELSGRENIFLNGSILGFSKEYLTKKFDEIVDFSGLENFIDIPIRNYSSGMSVRLAFSIATIVVPEVLIIDEILSVGDADFQAKSKKRTLELMHGGTTVIFVSHSIEQIRELCDRAMWLKDGTIKALGSTEDVCKAYAES
jgi:ABC-2 type transport system ATP-binding protein